MTFESSALLAPIVFCECISAHGCVFVRERRSYSFVESPRRRRHKFPACVKTFARPSDRCWQLRQLSDNNSGAASAASSSSDALTAEAASDVHELTNEQSSSRDVCPC